MAVLFDDRTGRLRLDQAAFDHLVVIAAGLNPWPESGGAPAAELSAAGAVPDGRPHPRLSAGLRAVIEPAYRLHLTLLDDRTGRLKAGDGWIDDGAAALLLDLPDGLREFVTLHPAFLPAALARVVRLGPRPRPRWEPVRLPAGRVAGLFAVDPAVRRSAAADAAAGEGETPGPGAPPPAILAGGWRAWRVEMTWTDPGGGPAGDVLDVVDTGDAGLCLVELYDAEAALWPATATAVWRLLIRMVSAGLAER
ncbi:MAG TPA: hypothetical protein VF069_00690 [Streptosporangiaceae bacterium]